MSQRIGKVDGVMHPEPGENVSRLIVEPFTAETLAALLTGTPQRFLLAGATDPAMNGAYRVTITTSPEEDSSA